MFCISKTHSLFTNACACPRVMHPQAIVINPLMVIYQRQPVKFHYGEIQGKKYECKDNSSTNER